MDDHILNKDEMAALARVSVRTLERWESVGEGPPRVRLGRRRIGYWKSDVLAWLRNKTTPSKSA